jgi:hypothetical protein
MRPPPLIEVCRKYGLPVLWSEIERAPVVTFRRQRKAHQGENGVRALLQIGVAELLRTQRCRSEQAGNAEHVHRNLGVSLQ